MKAKDIMTSNVGCICHNPSLEFIVYKELSEIKGDLAIVDDVGNESCPTSQSINSPVVRSNLESAPGRASITGCGSRWL